jgi:hypothetical protein
MPSIKIISDVALYSSLTAISGITTPSINITQSFTSPEITALGNASGTWDETYTTVRDNSAAWLDGGKDAEVRALTANWQNTFSSVSANSANWNEAYTWVGANSSTLDVSKIDIGNSHLANDETVKLSVQGNVVIYGDLSATGNTTLVNVTANVTDSLSVVNPGFGTNALTIEQSGPLPAIHASHYGTGPLLILSGAGNVGIGTDDPNSKLTVVGLISSTTPEGYSSSLANTSDVWYQTSVTLESTSGNWESVYSTVSSNSANWDYQGSDLRDLTGNYDSTFTTVSSNSANWNSVYTTFSEQSANFLTSYIEQQQLTFDTNTKVLTLDGGGSSPSYVSLADIGGGSDVSGLSGNWQNTYSTVSSTSSNWSNAYTTVNTKSANWESAAAGAGADVAVRALTGKWEATSTTVGTNSSSWQDTYTTVKNNSSSWVDQAIGTSGVYGGDTTVPQINVNEYGKIVSVSEQTITAAGIGAAAIGHTHNKSEINNFDTEVLNALSPTSNSANGYLKLNSEGKIPTSYIPGGVDEIIELSQSGQPTGSGDTTKLYVTLDNKVWRYSGTQYVEIIPSPGTTDSVSEGAINKYYTAARVQADAPVTSVNTKTGAVTLVASDVDAAATTHDHIAANITDFSTAADARVQAKIGTSLPKVAGAATAGTATNWAREDHVHPTDTSILNDSQFNTAVDGRITSKASSTTPVASDGTGDFGTGTTWARADHKHPSDATKANLAAPTFTGTVTTDGLTVNGTLGGTGFNNATNTRIEFYKSNATPLINGAATPGAANKWSPEDHVHPTDTTRAPLASPTFTGIVKAPTVSATTLYGNLLPVINEKTSSFTLGADDAGTIIKCKHPSAPITVTIPFQSSDIMSPGTQIIIVRSGDAEVSIALAALVTLYSVEDKRSLSSPKSLATLIYTGSNEWLFAGDIN